MRGPDFVINAASNSTPPKLTTLKTINENKQSQMLIHQDAEIDMDLIVDDDMKLPEEGQISMASNT